MEREERLMVLKIGRERYGVNINDVKEVVPNTEITNVLDKQSVYICGIMKCRYGCVSVLDIYKLFQVKPVSLSRAAIILTMHGHLLSFFAETVDCVITVSAEKIYDVPSIFNGAGQRYIRNVIVSDHNLVPIIDTARLFEKVGVVEETERLLR